MTSFERGDENDYLSSSSNQHRCVIDIETTGLAACNRLLSSNYTSYRKLSNFDSCRLVQLSWLILDNELNELERQTYIVKPDEFVIPLVSTLKSHGITQAHAMERGVCFSDIADKLELALVKCSWLVGHNLEFSRNVLMSEVYRATPQSVLGKLGMMDECCIMMRGKTQLNLLTNPSLEDLVRTFLSEEEDKTKLALSAKLYKVFERPL